MESARTTRKPIDASGLFLADKPSGLTSHDVVSIARHALGEPRIGHAGTLDPFASGLLVLLLGRATRLLPYLDGEPKEYVATIRLGIETDTGDPEGRVTGTADVPNAAALDAAMEMLTGSILQRPPAFSAKKVAGRRSYQAARRGETLAVQPVEVIVHSWEVIATRDGELDVRIICGGGTYVRALAQQLGELSRSAAHLSALRRIRSGPFSVADACSVDQIKAADIRVLPSLDAVRSLPIERLSSVHLLQIARGVPIPAHADGDRAALVDGNDVLIAIAQRKGDTWQPRVVLHDA
ncbi:MAG: tRNA pseudouridine(55) synthase TruB [Gemmatimonadaceae bacterium]